MYLTRFTLNTALLVPLLLTAPAGLAEGRHDHAPHHDDDLAHRQYDSHVHGMGTLNLVADGSEVHIELDSPAANLVGFEHAPSSATDRAALHTAVATLNKGDRLFRFDDDARCRMAHVHVSSSLLDEQHDDDQHGKEQARPAHADFTVDYRFECTYPGRLSKLSVGLFEAFQGMQEIELQYIVHDRQGAAELTVSNPAVKF